MNPPFCYRSPTKKKILVCRTTLMPTTKAQIKRCIGLKRVNYQSLNQLIGHYNKTLFLFFSLKEGPKCNVSLRSQLEPDLPNPKQPTSPCPPPFYGNESLKSPLSPPYCSISTSVAITLFLPKQWTHLTWSGPY